MLLTFPSIQMSPNNIVLQRYKGIFEFFDKSVQYVILASKATHNSIR
ncbi:hypothetical protein II5_05959 [Bacillus cereus MSX-A1]|nr:hypothetical protein [Bacillus cereus]EJQ97320.1 hypothetical protein II5_05959 [Bacillus cereus MSX-A1]